MLFCVNENERKETILKTPRNHTHISLPIRCSDGQDNMSLLTKFQDFFQHIPEPN